MKIFHVLTLLLVVIGGLHFALNGIGIDLLGTVFGQHIAAFHIAIGLATLYHVVPSLKAKLAAL